MNIDRIVRIHGNQATTCTVIARHTAGAGRFVQTTPGRIADTIRLVPGTPAAALPARLAWSRSGAHHLPYRAGIGRIRASFLESGSVANIKSAEKRARQTIKRRAHNMSGRSKLRTVIKNVVNAVAQGDKDAAAANLRIAGPIIDSAVNKGLIHRNKAARHKSQLNARVKELNQADQAG